MKKLAKRIIDFRAKRVVGTKSFQNRQNELVVLMYHGIVPKEPDLADWCLIEDHVFEQQVIDLKKNFDVLPLSEAMKKLEEGSLERPTASLTFDDGYANNFEVALPILKRHAVPACIFLATHFIGSEDTIWTARLQSTFSNTKKQSLEWRGTTYDLSNYEKKGRAVSAIKRILKGEDFSSISKETEALERLLDNRFSNSSSDYDCYRMMTKDMVSQMLDSNLIEFGAHTLNHPILSNLKEEEQQIEVAKSITDVEALTKRPCTLFAYPNGSKNDYSSTTVEVLGNSSASHAFTTEPGVNTPSTAPYELVRFGVGNNADFHRELYSQYN